MKMVQNMWYLEIVCSNHICHKMEFFSVLDEDFKDTIKFGDNSIVVVKEKWKVRNTTKTDLLQTISNVLFIPDLKTNLWTIG